MCRDQSVISNFMMGKIGIWNLLGNKLINGHGPQNYTIGFYSD